MLTNFHADGIKYLELRTIPRPSPHFTQEAYISTILSTITTFAEKHPDLTTRLILSLDRGEHTPADADAVVNLAIAHKPLVVGVDIAGNPSKGDMAIFGPALANAKAAGLGVTVHFAEVRTPPKEGELETILGFGPDRLGHVIHVPEDLRGEIIRRKVGLELCMSCNVHAKLFDGGFLEHHFREWWRVEECPVVLCVSLFFFSLLLLLSFGKGVEVVMLMVYRRMMWASFVVLCRMSICLRQSILISLAPISWI